MQLLLRHFINQALASSYSQAKQRPWLFDTFVVAQAQKIPAKSGAPKRHLLRTLVLGSICKLNVGLRLTFDQAKFS